MKTLSQRVTHHPLTILIAAIATMAAIVINPFQSLGNDVANGYVAHQTNATKRICLPEPPEYPGCSTIQINNWEDGDYAAAKDHYQEDRWGQDGFGWSKLGDAHNTKLKNLYNDAVDEYQDKMHARGKVGKAAEPKFSTWSAFKSGTDCTGGGLYAAIWGLMCRFSNAIDGAVPEMIDLTLVCGGWTAVITAVSAGSAAVFTAVAPEAVAGGALATYIVCTLHKLAGNLGIPTA